MGLENSDRGGGLGTRDRGQAALLIQDDGTPLGGTLCINVIPSGSVALDPVTGCATIDTSGGAAGDVQTASDFSRDNAVTRVDLVSGVRNIQQSALDIDDSGNLTNDGAAGPSATIFFASDVLNGAVLNGINSRALAASEQSFGLFGSAFVSPASSLGTTWGVSSTADGADENVAFRGAHNGTATGNTHYAFAFDPGFQDGFALRYSTNITAGGLAPRKLLSSADTLPAPGPLATGGAGGIRAATAADFTSFVTLQAAYEASAGSGSAGKRIKMAAAAEPVQLETLSGATAIAGEKVLECFTGRPFPLTVEIDPDTPSTLGPSLNRGIAGSLMLMRGASFPQIIMGANAGTGSGFFDVENNRPLLINNLHDGETVIGQGGLMAENSATDIGRSAGPAAAGVRFRDALLSRGIGVHGNTPPTAKISVTGSRGGNAALASLLTALASYGFITDNTTA